MTSLPGSEPTLEHRYQRQTLINQHGRQWDQAALRAQKVLVCGAGNIGGAVAVALAQAGFAWIDIVDLDVVTPSSLSRGAAIFREEDIGRFKAEAIAERLRAIDPEIRTTGFVENLLYEFGTARYREYDLILMATHDPHSRLQVNRYAHLLPGRTKAIIDGAIGDLAFSVQTTIIGEDPCYACGLPQELFDDPESFQSCTGIVTSVELAPAATNGMDGMAVGALMAKEAALIAAGLDPFFAGRELRFEAGRADILELRQRPSCTDHQRVNPSELVSMPFTTMTRLEELQAAIADELDCPVCEIQIFSRELLTLSLTCGKCDESYPVMRPQQAPLSPLCAACGNADPNRFRTELGSELVPSNDAPTLADYGIPERQILDVYARGNHRYLVPLLAEEERDDSSSLDPAA